MNEATNIGQWIITAGLIGNFILVWVKLSGKPEKRDLGPQPFRVSAEPEFAMKNHGHPDYISRADCRAMHIQAAQDGTGKIEQVQRQLDHLGTEIKGALSELSKDAETRASKLHARIDPISQLAQSTTDRLNDHFEDHRTGRVQNAG